MKNYIKISYITLLLSVVFLSGCGQKIDPKPYILQAEKEFTAANTPETSKYAADLLKNAEDALNEAKSIKDEKNYERAIALASKAEIYAKISQLVAEVKSTSETEVSKSKEAEAKAKAEVEVIKASLQRAKRVVPQLKAEIEKVLKELDTIFEEKSEGEKIQ
jgi:PBP1b-binding outer membrane lipoprotein LpoB